MIPARKVHFTTLGCKTNQYETQGMREKFLKRGYVETSNPEEADLFVINTCTVTGEGDRKSRSFIHKLHKENPTAQIAVTGCYATLNVSEIKAIPGVTFVIPNQEKDQVVERVSLDAIGKFCGEGDESVRNRYSDLSISYFADRTRAFIKIQDGCDHACTYCKVVIVRGPSRSRPLDDIIEEARRLRDKGYQEIVLTGIQLGAYGDEWDNGIHLVSVLERLLEVEGLLRIRLSSIDPSDVTEEMVALMRSSAKICKHLHLPLQSGDDEILKKMRRPYRRDHFLRTVGRLKDLVPDFSLTTDVMVGFPGEEEKHFQNTVDILERTLPLKVHIFPFSSREGTRAVEFEGQVSAEVIRERVKQLRIISGDLAWKYQSAYTGRVESVLVESPHESGVLEGYTSNYLKVRFRGDSSWRGRVVPIHLSELREDYFLGKVLSN